MQKISTNIDDYIAGFPENTQILLQQLRAIIQAAAPKAIEVISYNMPAFKQQKVLVYFAAYKHHIGFYPTSKPIEFFANELKLYKTSKGAIQLPLDKKLPKTLLTKIVKYRLHMVRV